VCYNGFMESYTIADPLSQTIRDSLKEHTELLQELLANRGFVNSEEIEAFLNPQYDLHLHNPFLLNDMDKAVERILKAIDAKEKIVVYSDYDADGIPGAAMMDHFFKIIGYENVSIYIPHRHDEGYGFHLEAIETFKEQEVLLIVTIDCGITSVEEVARANELGIDVIVTDHHECPDPLPDAIAVLDHKRNDSTYPEQVLCGTGVAFKLIQALLSKRDFGLKPGIEKIFIDLVGIATLSDMVPLTGENRAFAKFGLMMLRMSRRTGLVHLLRKLRISQRYITEDDISFMVTPRINAASRMGHPDDAFRLLSTDNEQEAGSLVDYLHKINDERKGVVAAMVKEIRKKLKNQKGESIVVTGNPKWKPALLGLAANSLAEDMGKPVFLWGREGSGVLKGSCRSGSSVSVMNIMEEASDSLIKFGGHHAAGGFAVSEKNIHTLPEILQVAYEKVSQEELKEEKRLIDRKLSFDDVTWKTFESIDKLAPFGVGNPKPLFLFSQACITSVRTFGKTGCHLELGFIDSKGRSISAIGFFMKPEQFQQELSVGVRISLIAHIEKSVFRGRPEIRLRIVDIV